MVTQTGRGVTAVNLVLHTEEAAVFGGGASEALLTVWLRLVEAGLPQNPPPAKVSRSIKTLRT